MDNISLCSIEDCKQLCELEKENFSPYECYSENQLSQMLQDSNYHIYKLFETQFIISYIILLKVENEYEILKICTHSNFKNQGKAGKLIDYVINKLPKPFKIFLEVRESNHFAIKLYLSKNFPITGKRKDYYGDESAILMEYSTTAESDGLHISK